MKDINIMTHDLITLAVITGTGWWGRRGRRGKLTFSPAWQILSSPGWTLAWVQMHQPKGLFVDTLNCRKLENLNHPGGGVAVIVEGVDPLWDLFHLGFWVVEVCFISCKFYEMDGSGRASEAGFQISSISNSWALTYCRRWLVTTEKSRTSTLLGPMLKYKY